MAVSDAEKPRQKRIRLSIPEAAEALGLHPEYLRSLVKKDLFTAIRPSGKRGVGRRIYLHPDEVEVYGVKGEAALRTLRIEKGRLKGKK